MRPLADTVASRLGLAPDRISAVLATAGVIAALGAASLELGRAQTSEEDSLSPYARASWRADGEGGLASVLYVGHLAGPMLLLAALVHARLKRRELDEPLREEEHEMLLAPAANEDAPRTVRRISVVLPRGHAEALARELRHAPGQAHRAIPALSRAIARAGRLEHVDHVLGDASDEAALELERAAVARRALGAPMATYRDAERAWAGPAGEHAILSFVLVTRTELDPLLDVPERRSLDRWLWELVPLRPEETLALDAFVLPRGAGADEATLSAALDLEPLRGEQPSRARTRAA